MSIYYVPSVIGLSAVETVDNSEECSFPRYGEPSAKVSLWVDGGFTTAVLQELFTPLAHPLFPFLYVKSVNVLQLGAGTATGQIFSHKRHQFDVTYGPWEASYSEKITNQAKMVTLPKWMFRWDDGKFYRGIADGEEPSRIVRSQKISHTYSYLQSVPSWLYQDVGTINSKAIASASGLVFDEETLLYEGGEVSINYDCWGTKGWQLTTNFSYNPQTWNKWFNAVDGVWMKFQKFVPDKAAEVDKPATHKGKWEPFTMYEAVDLTEKFHYDGSVNE